MLCFRSVFSLLLINLVNLMTSAARDSQACHQVCIKEHPYLTMTHNKDFRLMTSPPLIYHINTEYNNTVFGAMKHTGTG